MTTRAVVISLLVARAVIEARAPSSRPVIVALTPSVRAFVTSLAAPAALPGSHLLTEASDIITTELGDELITES